MARFPNSVSTPWAGAPEVPREWLAPAAVGSPQRCVATVRRQFDLGVDGLTLHGATPAELAPIVVAYAPGST